MDSKRYCRSNSGDRLCIKNHAKDLGGRGMLPRERYRRQGCRSLIANEQAQSVCTPPVEDEMIDVSISEFLTSFFRKHAVVGSSWLHEKLGQRL
jgi:hypothetical protein